MTNISLDALPRAPRLIASGAAWSMRLGALARGRFATTAGLLMGACGWVGLTHWILKAVEHG